MPRKSHNPRVLPDCLPVLARNLEPGDRVQRPRGPVFVIDVVSRCVERQYTTIMGHFEVSGYRKWMTIDDCADLEGWGLLERGE